MRIAGYRNLEEPGALREGAAGRIPVRVVA